MEFLRRPSTLAAAAAALLVLSVIALGTRGEGDDGPAGPDTLAGATEQPTGTAGDTPADGATAGEGQAEGATGSPPADGGDTGEAPAGDGGGIAVPADGDYAYASSGTWSLVGGGFDENHELPETATATVTGAEGTWQVRVAAGDDFSDTFSFVVGPDGGLDWTGWALGRTFDGRPGETTYDCNSDTAYYRSGEAGRTVQHACRTQDQASDGTIEQLGREELTLADGSVVQADRLSYTYTVSGGGTTATGDEFTSEGRGRLELWLDPATGLRLQEQRQIDTTTTFNSGATQRYTEDVTFTLQAPPAAG